MKTAFVLAIGLCALGLACADNLEQQLLADLNNLLGKKSGNHDGKIRESFSERPCHIGQY